LGFDWPSANNEMNQMLNFVEELEIDDFTETSNLIKDLNCKAAVVDREKTLRRLINTQMKFLQSVAIESPSS
jgi:hypothetical protein